MSGKIDLSGQRFGKLKVLKGVDRGQYRHPRWECGCDCGAVVVVAGHHLRSGATRSCGCLKQLKRLSLKGKRFGRLLVTQMLEVRDGNTIWECSCDCGKTTQVEGSILNTGKTASCGCKKSWGDIPGKWWCNVRGGAHSRGLRFEISIQRAWELFQEQKGICALTGRHISFKDRTASLDRINSLIGYEPSNLQWVHKHANMMKRELSQSEFINVCREVVRHHAPLE